VIKYGNNAIRLPYYRIHMYYFELLVFDYPIKLRNDKIVLIKTKIFMR